MKPDIECAESGTNIEESNCAKCTNFATKTTEGKGHFLLYGCRKLKIVFGVESDWKAKKNQPKNCKEFILKG